MKIHVRRRHIEKGKRGVGHACPVALACTEAMGSFAGVGYSIIWVDGAAHTMSRIAKRFIARFDAGKPVKPFAFVLK